MISLELGLQWLADELKIAKGLTTAIFTRRMSMTHRIFKLVEVEATVISQGPVAVAAVKFEANHLMDRELNMVKDILERMKSFKMTPAGKVHKQSQALVLHFVLPFNVTLDQIMSLSKILAEHRLMVVDGVPTPMICLIDSPNEHITKQLDTFLIKEADRAFTDLSTDGNWEVRDYELMLVKNRGEIWKGEEVINLVETHLPTRQSELSSYAEQINRQVLHV